MSFQPGAGAQAIFTNASIIRAYHESRGEADTRDEIITTIFSHPADSATPAVCGYKLIVLYPDESGYPDLGALKAALSERTAGVMITNPEDTGLYNPRIREYTDAVHAVGGLCSYDQANLNGIMGIARAQGGRLRPLPLQPAQDLQLASRVDGPRLGGGHDAPPPCAASCPRPLVEFDGERYYLDHDLPDSIGKVRQFLGNLQVVLRSYAWVMSLGADGLVQASETAVINNNYLSGRLADVRGLTLPYAPGVRRLDEARWSWGTLHEDTGVGSEDIEKRIIDYGVNNYFGSHEPWVVPEPFTPEPAESYSKADIDEYAEIMRRVADEAYATPELFEEAPYKSSVPFLDEEPMHDITKVITTWRVWARHLG